MLLYDLATVLVVAAAIPATAFPFVYHLRTRGGWRNSTVGWHLMSMTTVMALFLLLAASVHVFGPYPGVDVVAVVLYALVAILLWQRLVLVIRATRRGR